MSLKIPASIAILVLVGLSGTAGGVTATTQAEIDSIYIELNVGESSLPSKEVFDKAMSGFLSLAEETNTRPNTISIIDFTLPSTEKRLWIIDLTQGRILHHLLVAHGKNSGELYAKEFSNKPDSYKSSLGFYRTGQTYTGKHGLSLRLHGLEPGINDQAEARAIVIHGADYVDEEYARRNGRLGRSWGCPAIPMAQHKEIINLLAGGSCVFIYYPDQNYLSKSRLAGA